MKKNFIVSLMISLGVYTLFSILVGMNAGTVKYMAPMMVLASLAVSFIIGGLISKHVHQVAILIAVGLPYAVGAVFYSLGRIFTSHQLIAVYRQFLPQVYFNADSIAKLLPSGTGREIVVGVGIVVTMILSYLCVQAGIKLKQTQKTWGKFIYNVVLVWGVQFCLFTAYEILVSAVPRILVDEQVKFYFAFIGTIIIFMIYFFVGRSCLTIKNQLLQVVSMMSASVTSFVIYALAIGLGVPFGMWMEIGIYERYVLPIGTSFFGVICEAIGKMTGAMGGDVRNYGMFATCLLVMIPTLLIYMGKYASTGAVEQVAVEGAEEVQEEIKEELEA